MELVKSIILLILFWNWEPVNSIEPVIALPPVIYWNSSNFVAVTWLKGREDTYRGFIKVFKDETKPPFASNALRLQPGETALFELPANKVGKADRYKLSLHESATGYKSDVFEVPGVPNLKNAFIQTDKPLYKAGQLVQIRILPLTSLGEISKISLEIQLENPERFVLMSRTLDASDGFIRTEFQLPDHLSYGVWRIRVRPTLAASDHEVVFFKEFEVKEYDLPHFQVRLFVESEEELFETGSASVVVAAKYSFGKAAFGEVKIYCGRQEITSSENLLFATPILTGEVEDGLFRGRINVTECRWRHWRKRRVELTAAVRDHGTGDLESHTAVVEPKASEFVVTLLKPGYGETTSWSLVPFMIEPLIPGSSHPTTIHLEAICMIDPPIAGTRIRTLMSFEARIGEFLQLNVTGSNCNIVMFNITDSSSPANSKLLAVPKVKGLASIIHVDPSRLRPAHYQAGNTFEAFVDSASTSGQNSRVASYMLLCNKVLVDSGQSSSTGRIAIELTENMVPNCFLIVYRSATQGTNNYPIVDILKFFVSSGCSENVNISTSSVSSRPGSVRDLVFRGPANGLVGIRAYDERISYLLHKEFLEVEHNEETEWEFMLALIGNQKENTMEFSGLFDRQGITNSIEQTCQFAGLLWWNKYHKCPNMQKSRSSISSLCREKFLTNCGAMDQTPPESGFVCENKERCVPSLQENSPQGDPVRLDFEVGAESTNIHHDGSVRSFFPETWLFHEFRLNSTGAIELQAVVPHSVTNWTVSGHFWGSGWQKLCAAPPISITSFKKFFLRVELPEEIYLGEFLLVKVTVFLFDPHWQETETEQPDHKVGICYHDANPGVCTDLGSFGRRYTGGHILTMVARSKGTGSKTLPFEFLETGQFRMLFDLKDFATEMRCEDAPLLDRVERTVLVKDRETVEEYTRSFIMNPTKPKTSVTTHELDDEYLQYIEFLDEDNEKNRNKLRAQLDIRVPENMEIKRLDVEFSRFLSHVRPTSLESLDEDFDSENNEISGGRSVRRRRRSTQFLSDILKKTSVTLYQYKAGSKPGDTNEIVENLETTVELSFTIEVFTKMYEGILVLADIFTFSDCHRNASQCGYAQTRWPTTESQRSQWLTILATSLNCESGMNATVVCPSLRWILLLHQQGLLKSDYSDAKLASSSDEALLIKAMVFTMIYECSSYKEQCERNSDDPFPMGTVSQSLYFGFTVDEKVTDPIAIAAVTHAVSYANSPLMDIFQHYLYATIKQESVAPFWTYGAEESMMQKIKNRLSAWLGSSRVRLRKANEILLNSLGFLAFINEQTDGIDLNLDPLADWLFSQQKDNGMFYYTLDTYFATRAMYLYKIRKSGLLGHKNLTVSLECSECSFTERRLDDRRSLIHIPVYAKRLKVSVSGLDKVKFGVKMILSKPQRLRRHLEGGEEPTENWPMDITATTDIVGSGPVFNQTVCLRTVHSVLTDMVGVEHGIFTGYSPDKESFTLQPGSGCAFHGLDVASHVVQFLLTNLTAQKTHCYSLKLNPPSVSHSSSLAPVPVMTKHPEHGLTGRVFLKMSSVEELTRSQVDKVCYSDDHCVCTEGSCQNKMCEVCQKEENMGEMTKFVCQPGKFGAVVKSLEVERIGEDYIKMTASIRHVLSPDDRYLTECEECEIYQRICRGRRPRLRTNRPGRYKCPLPEANKLYFIAGISSRWHVDANSTTPIYFIGENDYFERFLSCPATWQQRVLHLSSVDRRLDICSEHSTS